MLTAVKFIPLVLGIAISPLIPANQAAIAPPQAPPQNETKLGKFLTGTSMKFQAKKINLPNVKGTEDDTFFLEIVSAISPKNPQVSVRGLRITGFRYSRVGSITERAFIDEDELPELIEGIRAIVKEATAPTEVDFGDLGKEKVVNTIRVVSREGLEFTYDETLVGAYVVVINHRGYQAGSKEALTKLADGFERASNLLKKL